MHYQASHDPQHEGACCISVAWLPLAPVAELAETVGTDHRGQTKIAEGDDTVAVSLN